MALMASPDLYTRRETLFRTHSLLRSIDNLRPDEALDELVLLYGVWIEYGPVDLEEVRQLAPDLQLSEAALAAGVEHLWPMFRQASRGGGADLFQELVTVGVRAGMGQYFTPQPVAEAMAEYLAPQSDEWWLDPFCGSGLLLGEIAERAGAGVRLFGVDRDPRVLHLARLEARLNHPHIPSVLLNANALQPAEDLKRTLEVPPEGFDGVVTNPPFGAELHDHDRTAYDLFALANQTNGRTPLEILGLEQSIRLLRPGGRLGIVLPQSVLTNRRDRRAREFLLENCSVDAVLSLPGETFGPFQGVGKAAVVFATRRLRRRGPERATWLGIARSVGYDSAGKAVGESDIADVAACMRDGVARNGIAAAHTGSDLRRNMTPEWHLREVSEGIPLSALCIAIFAGRSPARNAYLAADDPEAPGAIYRILKVGDLTGSGIDWSIGERGLARFPRVVTTSKLLRVGDIVTTAAAHHPRYIGAKVDVVDVIPPEFEDRAMPCAELMVMRPDPAKIDLYALLLWLRSDEGRAAIQACIIGQTAHLHAAEVGEIVVPERILDADVAQARHALEESLRLRRLSEVQAADAERLFAGALGRSTVDLCPSDHGSSRPTLFS